MKPIQKRHGFLKHCTQSIKISMLVKIPYKKLDMKDKIHCFAPTTILIVIVIVIVINIGIKKVSQRQSFTSCRHLFGVESN
jgi:hypothetical protein